MWRLIKRIVAIGLLGVLLAVATLIYHYREFRHEPVELAEEELVFAIEPGANIRSIARELTLAGIIEDPWLFVLMARLEGVETRVRAGEYRITAGATPGQILEQFARGSSIQYQFTVIEGWSFRQMLDALADDPIIVHTLAGKTDIEIMQAIGYPDQHPEGRFFPDTYRFPRGTTDVDFLRRAYQVMQMHLDREWQQRSEGLPLQTAYEALILASIIEKETGAGFERPLIAAVFIERLKRNMRLQTDPTVIYGLGESFDGDIRFRDLRKDTPYNTYLRAGLPPTPIALPGLDSIRAALHPAESDALYFVSRGDGTHQFSRTLEEHNAAVRRYQLKRR